MTFWAFLSSFLEVVDGVLKMTSQNISSIIERLLLDHLNDDEESAVIQPILDRWTLRCENEIAECLRYGIPLPPYLKRTTIVPYKPSFGIVG